MYASKLLMPATQLLIARIQNIHDLFALVSGEIQHLLLVLDPALEPEPALGIALEVAERWARQITLVHGGRLWAEERSSQTAALADLLCLSWQVKHAYRDISISQTLPTSLAELLEEANKRNADLIIIPEVLAASFWHPELTLPSSNPVLLCPIAVVTDWVTDWRWNLR